MFDCTMDEQESSVGNETLKLLLDCPFFGLEQLQYVGLAVMFWRIIGHPSQLNWDSLKVEIFTSAG